MTLAQLEYFLAVCETKSITQASVKCHISQPAMTAQIKTLESELGLDLFVRSNKNISMTPAAEILRQKALLIKATIDDFYTAAETLRQNRPLCNIGVSINCGILYQEQLRDFQNESENFQFRIHFGSSHNLYKRVLDKELDAALICNIGKLLKDNITINLPIHDTRIVFATYPGHSLAQRPFITAAEIAETKIIAFSESEVDTPDNPFLPLFSLDNILFYTNQISVVKSYIINGQASTFIMEDMVENIPGIVTVPISGLPKATEMLVWHKKNKNQALKPLIRFAEEKLKY